jgi:hypothetical protein
MGKGEKVKRLKGQKVFLFPFYPFPLFPLCLICGFIIWSVYANCKPDSRRLKAHGEIEEGQDAGRVGGAD